MQTPPSSPISPWAVRSGQTPITQSHPDTLCVRFNHWFCLSLKAIKSCDNWHIKIFFKQSNNMKKCCFNQALNSVRLRVFVIRTRTRHNKTDGVFIELLMSRGSGSKWGRWQSAAGEDRLEANFH